MQRVISWIQRLPLRWVLSAIVFGFTLLVNPTFGSIGDVQPAYAAPLTQDKGSSAQSRPAKPEQVKDNAQPTGGGLIESVKEKLNLDEPLPDSTKAFFKQVQGEDVKVEEPRPSGKGEEALE